MRFRLGEMFCGPGGISLGAEMASDSHDGPSVIDHAWALDYHADTLRTYRENFGPESSRNRRADFEPVSEEHVFQADVREFDLDSVPQHNAFAFGFPCNDFSTIGESRGLEGTYGGLYTYGVASLAKHHPDWFLAENVTGLSHANGGRAFGQILAGLQHPGRHVLLSDPGSAAAELQDELKVLEYDLVAHRYHFEEYGVPQKRHRILIVGIRKDLADKGIHFRVPAPTTPEPQQWKTAGQALAVIGPNVENNKGRPLHPRVKARMELIPPGGNAFNTDFSERPDLKLNVRGATFSNIYRKLRQDEPSYTVTGSGGGGTHMYHWDEPRALTNRERARLQTFPDDFIFKGTQTSVRRQVGMAVPPMGAAVIIEAILRAFDRKAPAEGAFVEPNIDARELIRAWKARAVDSAQTTLDLAAMGPAADALLEDISQDPAEPSPTSEPRTA